MALVIIVIVPNEDSSTKIKLMKVLYTPDVSYVLVSVGQIDDAGYYNTFGGGRCEIADAKRKVIGIILKKGGVYRTYHVPKMGSGLVAISLKSMMCELHARLGHMNVDNLKGLLRQGLIKGVEVINLNEDFECRVCILAKKSHKPVLASREGERKTALGEEIHSDAWGLAPVKTLGSWYYYVSFTDDWSHWTTAYLMYAKSEVFECYKSFAAWVKTQLGVKIKCLHSD
jgi:hypothetical protein